jgi:hypothetical protein
MSSTSDARTGYVVPRYRAEGDTVWYHVLHGTVPGYQIDFMYCPEVPHGAFTQNHFGHLARLMKYLEPRERAPYAFALGNLSRDDVQHEPGHGGVALILGLRVQGVLDHAGRAMPPYAHAILAVDRALDPAALRDAALSLQQRLLPGGRGPREDTSDRLYRRYARAVRHHPGTVESLLRRHIDGFAGLPRPAPSRLGWSYIAADPAPPQRITITHADDAPFERLAQVMARLGAMLYRSNIKWTSISISSGRELDIAGGVSVRLVPESEATADSTDLVVPIDDIPEDEAAMARTLFGASPRAAVALPARVGWRARDAAKKAAEAAGSERRAPRATCATAPFDPAVLAEDDLHDGAESLAPTARRRLWLGLAAAGASVCAIGAILGSIPDPRREAASATLPSASLAPAQASSAPTSSDAAGSRAPPERLDVFALPSARPPSAIRRPDGRSGAPSTKATAPRPLTPSSAPGAIGGKPRF